MASLHGMVVDVTNPVYDYNWICSMMKLRKRVKIVGRTGHTFEGLINCIRPEDGSGKNWLLTISHDLKNSTVFVKAL